MENVKQHWKILQKLESDLAYRVRSFLVIGEKGEGVIVATKDGEGFWLGEMEFGLGKTKTVTKPTPLYITGLIQMAQGDTHILLLNKQGDIYSMGQNNRRQLGLGTVEIKTNFSPSLISIPHKFISVRCGGYHSLALTEDGKVCAWGSNDFGQVGVPISTDSLSFPRQIPEFDLHQVVAVECGGWHSLVLTDQGEVYAWGENEKGQLGDESATVSSRHTPTQIPTTSPVRSMAAGSLHTLLLTQTGEVYACGWNGCGQLGLPTTTESSASLVKVVGLPPISQIASHHATHLSIAISADQRCFVWGELSDRTFFSTPQELPQDFSTVQSPLSFFSTYRNTPHSVTIPETPPSPLSARMSRMFDNPETSDVQFVVEQRTIHAHRNILSNSSDYFSRMFSEKRLAPVDPEDPIVRVTIPDHSYQVFHAFLRFLYTDCLEVHPDLHPKLFELANQYLESDLQQFCLSRMRTTITPSTCCLYYQLTNLHSLSELAAFQQESVQFGSTRMLEVIATSAFQSMDAKLCKKLVIAMAIHSP